MTAPWIKRTALLLGSTVVVLAAAEVCVRVWFEGRFGQRPPFFVADDEVVWRPAPNLDDTYFGGDFKTTIRTDAFGCRLGELGPVPDGSEVYLLGGDSNAFGWGVNTEETLASRLDVQLDGHTDHAVRLANAGVFGYGTLLIADRIRQFLAERPGLRPRGVVYLHTQNDAHDNAKLEHYAVQQGYWRCMPATFGWTAPTPFHLYNCVERLLTAGGGAANAAQTEADALDPDALFSFRIVPDKAQPLPVQMTLGGEVFLTRSFTPEQAQWGPTSKRRATTPLQQRLIEVGVKEMHRAMAGRNALIFHIVVPTAPRWFFATVEQAVQKAPAAGNRVVYLGRVPKPPFEGEIRNTHSGKHFNARFSALWAEALYAAMAQHDDRLP